MFHIKSRDQVYICSRYTTPYFGAMSQFSGWLQLPDFQMSYQEICGISFHGMALSAKDKNVLSYWSKENPDDKKSQLIMKSNVTIVVMSNTVASRGLTSEMPHVIDGINVTLSVIDGQCISLLQRGLYFLSWTVHAYNDSVILSSLAVDHVIIRNLTVTSLPDCHTVSTAEVVLLQRQESTTIKIKILDGEIGKLGVYLSGFMIASFET
uniref:TNF family profile domain-containing protein n=1 Tax=Magallana gigas TaxID=29159 RepID=K1R6Y7_MAGGI